MAVIIVLLCICGLVLMITWGKLNPFLAFMIISLVAGLLLGIPLQNIGTSIQKGVGDILGSLAIIISTGAMLGKMIAQSGAAQRIALVMMRLFGKRYILWAVMLTGFIIGIPLFYSVGFVLVIPLIFSVSYQYRLPAIYVATPMLASLSIAQGFLPPHPAPAALVVQFHASMGKTLLYGIAISIPPMIIAGPLFARTLKKISSAPLKTYEITLLAEEKLPGILNSFFSALLPVFLLLLTTLLPFIFPGEQRIKHIGALIGDPPIVMLLSLFIATCTLGRGMNITMKALMNKYTDAVKDIAMILLVMAGAGAFKQILIDSGISEQVGRVFLGAPINPLILGWTISAVIRVCLGSATIAGLTTAGIIAPLMAQMSVDPSLMVLAIGAGSLMFSHVNDPAFWMFKEYFTLSFNDTIRSWSLMETTVAIVGLLSLLILSQFV
jgi:Gnt-I system high-affinity gluconate transporter